MAHLQTQRRDISTHTPREGRDKSGNGPGIKIENFNSHAPRGARLPEDWLGQAFIDDFNSHAPRGARPVCRFSPCPLPQFQLTRPARGATLFVADHGFADDISTHTPREGRDSFLPVIQPTPPNISTHTPREGRDGCFTFILFFFIYFNSHAPRGARPAEKGGAI